MQISTFISVGENIHCTRIYKVDGRYVKPSEGGKYVIHYQSSGKPRRLAVPENFMESADWEAGKVKHCAVAIWQANYGDDDGRSAGNDYLRSLAKSQETNGASYLDINVDEFSTDVEERKKLMRATIETVQDSVSIPMSIDSSNVDILREGLHACDTARGKPMVNSVSLERADVIEAAAEFGAVIIASASGEKDMPQTTDDRLANLGRLMPKLVEAGFDNPSIHVDPLVVPISVDGSNGRTFLDAVSAVRKTYGDEIHIVAGLSNVSFGMPKRKLINQVFSYLAVQAGADGGIVDPRQINVEQLNTIDPESEPFKLAKALLLGEDEFGMNYITAAREGNI